MKTFLVEYGLTKSDKAPGGGLNAGAVGEIVPSIAFILLSGSTTPLTVWQILIANDYSTYQGCPNGLKLHLGLLDC